MRVSLLLLSSGPWLVSCILVPAGATKQMVRGSACANVRPCAWYKVLWLTACIEVLHYTPITVVVQSSAEGHTVLQLLFTVGVLVHLVTHTSFILRC